MKNKLFIISLTAFCAIGFTAFIIIFNSIDSGIDSSDPISTIEPETINRNEIPDKKDPEIKLKVENYKKKKDEFMGWEISGEIKNTTGRDLEFLDIRIDCFDKESALIEQGYGSVTDFKKGTTWKFKELILENFEEIKFIIETN